MDEEELIERAEAFAKLHGCTVGERLGFGIHGIVVVLNSESKAAATALKVLASAEPYRRERGAYQRLGEARITKVRGFHVPQLLRWDDDLLALEMTVVTPPFALDFAGAYLDFPPDFPVEAWQDWQRKNEEQFGEDWPEAQAILRRVGRDRRLHARSFAKQLPLPVSGHAPRQFHGSRLPSLTLAAARRRRTTPRSGGQHSSFTICRTPK